MENNKVKQLKLQRSFNKNGQKLRDETYLSSDFFDPNDVIQVKYEMLRKVEFEKQPISKVSALFGFSRVAYYKAKKDLKEGGLSNLTNKTMGPKRSHKLNQEILDFVISSRKDDSTLTLKTILDSIKVEFNVVIHRRTLERALAKSESKKSTK